MFTFGYRDRKWRIVKDICFVAVAILLLVRGGTFGIILGALAAYWYGRDLYVQVQALRAEKPAREPEIKTSGTKSASDSGKITITDLSDAKEVNFEKER